MSRFSDSRSRTLPPDKGMNSLPCRFSDRELLVLSIELVLLVLLVLDDLLPRVAAAAAIISSGDGIMWWSKRREGLTYWCPARRPLGEGGTYVVAGRSSRVSSGDTVYDWVVLSPSRTGLESGEDSGDEDEEYEIDRFIVTVLGD